MASIPTEPVVDRIRKMYGSLRNAEKRVADVILANPSTVSEKSIAELAAVSGVSDATVVRMCKHLDIEGYYQLRILLSRDYAGQKRDAAPLEAPDALETAKSQSMIYLTAVSDALDREAMHRIAERIASAQTVLVAAAGNTKPLASDLAFRLNRFRIRSYSSPSDEDLFNYVSNATDKDLLLVYSKSGSARRVLQLVSFAKSRGVFVVVITGDLTSQLAHAGDEVLFSGTGKTVLTEIQHGLESHIGEQFISDMLLAVLATYVKGDEDAELAISSWKL